jgi:hypothetical protein
MRSFEGFFERGENDKIKKRIETSTPDEFAAWLKKHGFLERTCELRLRMEKLISFLLANFHYEHAWVIYCWVVEALKPKQLEFTVIVPWDNPVHLFDRLDDHLRIFDRMKRGLFDYNSLLSALTSQHMDESNWRKLMSRLDFFRRGGVTDENILTYVLPHLFDATGENVRKLTYGMRRFVEAQTDNWNNIYHSIWARSRYHGIDRMKFIARVFHFSQEHGHAKHFNSTVRCCLNDFSTEELEYILSLEIAKDDFEATE